jgi:hypothetical protein
MTGSSAQSGQLKALVSQGLLAAECRASDIDVQFLCGMIPAGVAHVEPHKKSIGLISAEFGHGLRLALNPDDIIGSCPLVAPSSFPYSSLDGMSPDLGM